MNREEAGGAPGLEDLAFTQQSGMVLSLGVLEFGLDDHTLRVVGERARL